MTTYEEAYAQSLEYFNGDTIATSTYLSKYALTSPEGDIEEPTPEYMHKRLAKELARIESKYDDSLSEEQIFDYLDRFKYIIPQGSPMAGVGNPYQITSLSNCFVIEAPYDSYGGILKTDQEQAQLMKRRGGVGFDISTIRPQGIVTSNAAKTTDGIGIFMERFSNTCREVAQGGRRGALMITISVHHPEIRTFINIKRDLEKVTGANISIRLSDEFMEAVKTETDVELRWPVDSDSPTIRTQESAKEIWDDIIEGAHISAEPGLLFWDNVTKWSPADAYKSLGFGTVSTNPCGEITLSPYDSCRLLLVNTLSFVKEPFTSSASFDFALFGKTVQDAQRLMDDIIDLEIENIDRILYKIEKDPEPEEVKAIELNLWKKIRKSCIEGRRTGLGVTAIGDTVAALNVVYGTEESVTVIENIYRELALNSYRSSVAMAASRGTFGVYDYELEKDHPFILRIMNLDPKLTTDWKKYGRRNIANTTTAPAGSVSICAQTTSGIEPAFQVSYTRRKKINPDDKAATVDFVDDLGDSWQHFDIFHHGFKKWMEVTNSTVEDYEQSPFFGAMANDINWIMKVKAQAAAQKWICHSISNTTNVPNDTTIDTIKDIYVAGWETGCKGITIYRDGCRAGVLVNPTTRSPSGTFADNEAPERPDFLPCDIYHMTVRGEKWNAFVGLMDNRPYEIFAGRAEYVSIPRSRKTGTINKNGKYNVQIGDGENEIVIKDLAHIFENTTESAFTRTISLALRHGTPVQYIVEQLSKGADKESEMFSLSKGLMRVLKNYISDGTEASQKKCSNCDTAGNLVYQEGCVTCHDCGFSKCG